MLVLQNKKNHLVFLIGEFTLIIISIILFKIGFTKAPSQELALIMGIIIGGGLIVFISISLKRRYMNGTLSLIKLETNQFKIIKPISCRSIKWDDIVRVEYNRAYEFNSLYIEVTYLFDNKRVEEIINIYYREEVNKYFVTYCSDKIVNTPDNPSEGKQKLSELI